MKKVIAVTALVLVVAGALWTAVRAARTFTPEFPELAASSEGSFPLNGQYPGPALLPARGVRVWGSWAGDDAHTGALTLGPFPSRETIRFAVGGYPAENGLSLQLEHVATRARHPIKVADNIGAEWKIIATAPPREWLGQDVVLIARDASSTVAGWIALSEPLHGGPESAPVRLLQTLLAWALNGLIYGALWLAFARFLARRDWVAAHWIPLVAAAGAAACGYLTFWCYFAGLLFGKTVSVAIMAAALGLAWHGRRGRTNEPPLPTEILAAPKMMCAIGLFCFSVLHLFPTSDDAYWLARTRWRSLPTDNALPHETLEVLWRGEPLRKADADWLSSDRPPLQTGWLLMTWPLHAALPGNGTAGSATAAVWLQSIWVLAGYGLFRTLGLSRARACGWLGFLAVTGFFLVNTMFTWPKLSAAAFACGAFGLWALRQNSVPTSAQFVLGGALAALAYLSHSGVAFSFLPLLPWAAWRMLRGEGRQWALVALVGAAFVGPWMAYQRFYDPPGNRLVKWHLAGQVAKDPRGTIQTLRESYGALTWPKIVENKLWNFRSHQYGNWDWWFQYSRERAWKRWHDEFFYPARAFTWWLPAALLLPIALWRGRLRPHGRAHLALALWAAATVVTWCLLMFQPASTVIHQGSYAHMLVLFVLFSVWLDAAGRWLIALLAVLQVATFSTTWCIAGFSGASPLNAAAVVTLLLAFALGAGLVWREGRADAIQAAAG